MTKKLVKALAATLCAVVLIVGTIAGTVAYLTSKDEVQNTFTAGKVAIEMDEKNVNDPTARVKTNEYKLVPGRTYVNELTIHVEAKSEPCYLFVKVDNTLLNVADLTFASNWNALDENAYPGVYYYNNGTVNAADSQVDIDVIKSFTVKKDATHQSLNAFAESYKAPNPMKFFGYAVQSEGFDNAKAAWGATFGADTQNQVQS